MYCLDEDSIFDRILREEEQSGNNIDVLSDDAILIIMKTKRTFCDIPGCVAGASKIQTESENISLKCNFRLIFNCEFLLC